MRYIGGDEDLIMLPNPCRLIITGDAHPSSIAFQQVPFEDTVTFCAQDRETNRVIVVGDMNNAIGAKDKRYAVDEVNPDIPNFEAERRYIKRQLSRLGSTNRVNKLDPDQQIIAYLTGNHEETISKDQGDVAESISEDLGVRYAGRQALIDVKQVNPADPENPFKLRIFAMHGYGSLSSNQLDVFERQHKLRRGLRQKFESLGIDADMYVCGHYHKYIDVHPMRELKMRHEDGHWRPYYEWSIKPMLAAPSFLATYSEEATTYEEAQGKRLNEIGCAFVIIEDGVVVDMNAIVYI